MKVKYIFFVIGLFASVTGAYGAQAGLVQPQLSAYEQKWLDIGLFCAVEGGNVERVQSLIAKGANVIARDRFDRIPLHYAYYHPAVMKILINANPSSVNLRDMFGSTPLMDGITMGRLPAIRMLLSAGVNVGIRSNNGASAVHQAAVFGICGEILVSTLLAYAPEAVNVKHGRTGDTPLMWALYSDKSLIPFLISVGANPDIPNKLGKTPRKLAQELGCEDLLAERGDTKPARAISLDISKK